MRKIQQLFIILSSLFLSNIAWAGSSVDTSINSFLTPISNKIAGMVFYSFHFAGADIRIIVLWLILGAIFCTFYFKFVNLTYFKHAIDLVRGKYDDPNATGEVSHFKALATAISGTVGLGNISGVAIAVSLGGPGAVFWMILAGFLAMSLKFCECTLGVKYRIVNADGSVSGGPMYYLSAGLQEKGIGWLGKILAIFFSIFCIGGALGGGNMFQANQSFQQFVLATGGSHSFFADKGWLFGLILAIALGFVIIGGIKSIAKVTSKLVPFMAVVYLIIGLIVIFYHISDIPTAFFKIITEAFAPTAVSGGVLGALIIGFQRAAFSNEAGLGSAPIAHSAVKTDTPITEGIVSLLEPFIDTMIICTVTALVIVITGMHQNQAGLSGIALTSAAFAQVVPWFPSVLALAAILFAFSTMIAWSYYGLKAWSFLFGHSNLTRNIFKIIFCIFVVIGASIHLSSVLDISDSMIFLMSVPNVIGVYILASVVKKEAKNYKY